MSLSIIKSVVSNGTWQNQSGETMYRHDYEMDDGTKMQANHKSELPFKVGEGVDYEVKKDDPKYGKSGSVKKPEQPQYSGSNGSGGGDNIQRIIVRQNALKHAVNILIHNASNRSPKEDVDPVDVAELAGRLMKWVMGSEKKTEPKAETPPPAPAPVVEEENDDLPF